MLEDTSNNAESDESQDRDVLIDEIADEFLLAAREGKITGIDAFVRSHPKVTEDSSIEQLLRRMLETLRLLHGLGAESFAVEKPVEPLPEQESGLPEIADYRLLRVAGRVGMGVVYEAMQLSLSRKVALKVLPEHSFGNANSLARFQLEARSAAGLHHTNIVPVFDVGNDGRHCFYAMQFIEGHSLDEVIRQLRRVPRRQAYPSSPNRSFATLHASDVRSLTVLGTLTSEASSIAISNRPTSFWIIKESPGSRTLDLLKPMTST